MKLHKYKDLEEYRQIQEQGNKRKLSHVWISTAVVDVVSDYIKEHIDNPSLGICHGTRRGVEQQMFMEKTGAQVIGTEISSTATQFPHTIQWDFHDVKDEWINNIDFIYSNSFDHSHTPELALSQWLKCLKDDGLCFIEWEHLDRRSTKLDPFGSSRSQLKRLLKKGSNLVAILKARGRTGTGKTIRDFTIFVVKKRVENV